MKKTFIHTFKNGNRVTLVMDFTGEPKADCSWDRTTPSEWKDIQAEYIEWRKSCFKEFLDGLTKDEQLEVMVKSGAFK